MDNIKSLQKGNKFNYPLVDTPEWAKQYFKNNPNVSGMAIGGGMNGIDGDRQVILNPYTNYNKDAVLKNERFRHYFDEYDFKLPNITKEQMNKYKETPYEGDSLNIGRTETSRYLSGDKHLLTKDQIKYIEGLNIPQFKKGGVHIKTNKKLIKRAAFAKNSKVQKYQKGGLSDIIINIGEDIGRSLVPFFNNYYYFFRDGKLYTPNTPHDTMAQLINWDTEGNLAKIEFKERAINDPNAFINTFSTKYRTHYNNNNFDALYNTGKTFYPQYINRKNNLKIGNQIYNNLTDGWSKEQIAAALGNSYVETGGWTQLQQSGDGPASGVFMMEPAEREYYNDWLRDNDLKDSYINQTNYVQHLFDTKNERLQTPWSRLSLALPIVNKKRKELNEPIFKDVTQLETFVNSIPDENTAKKYGVRGAWLRKGYTTDQAWKDWNSGNVKKQTRAFEALFERAGVPHFDRRDYTSNFLYRNLLNYFESK